MISKNDTAFDHEAAVRERYGAAAARKEDALCCPTNYDPRYLAAIPGEILAKDYGCGDPSRWVQHGETVIDLGSGAGKICYILSQRVGPEGRVVGVDMNDAMLELARSYQSEMARRIGYANVEFVKARIQDMTLDLEALDAHLRTSPVCDLAGLEALEDFRIRMRAERPAVPDSCADAVVSNCVLNLVRPADKTRLFREIHRVLKRGGRAVISDIVCDETPDDAIRSDPELWSGCIAGAFREDEFLAAFEDSGFYGAEIIERASDPWRVIHGVEFRSMTVRAFKGKEGPCLERNQAVVYRGPFSLVKDDDGHTYPRGRRVAICDKTFHLLTAGNGPYAGLFEPVPPRVEVSLAEASPFECRGLAIRDPRETKGAGYRTTTEPRDASGCNEGACC